MASRRRLAARAFSVAAGLLAALQFATAASASGGAQTPIAAAGGGPLLWVLIALLGGLLVAGAAVYLKHWYDSREPDYQPLIPSVGPAPTPPRFDGPNILRDSPTAHLQMENGQSLEFSGLATLGVDADCTFRLPISSADFGHGELRIWFANQRYIIHDISPRSRIRVNGRPVAWSFLSDGDEIEVRGVKLRFLSKKPSTARY